MRRFRTLAVAAVMTAGLPCQQALFFRNANLFAAGPFHADVAAAVRQLCEGPRRPSAGGVRTHLPVGTRMLACQRTGATVRVTFSADLLRAAPGCDREHAIEQIDKTVLAAAGVDRCEVYVEGADGAPVELGVALGRPPQPPALRRRTWSPLRDARGVSRSRPAATTGIALSAGPRSAATSAG